MASTSRGVRTRKKVIEAAYRLFLRQGYHGTPMRQVARRAGVTPAAIYNHFESKEALFTAVLLARVPHRALTNALAGAQGESVEALTHDALQRMQSAMADQLDNFRLISIELIEFQGRHAEELAKEFVPKILAFIEEMKQADGRLRDFSELILARSFFGLFVSYAIMAAMLPQFPGFEATPASLEAIGEIFLHGVLQSAAGGEHDQ